MIETLTVQLKNKESEIILFEVPKFDVSKQFYWKKDRAILLGILQEIANIVINQPYQLDPDKYLMTTLAGKPFKIYRQNHDVTHALRQYFYVNYLFKRTRDLVASKWLIEMIDEETAILHLSAFCLRIGRLNEDNIKTGSSHELHSAELFESIALQLGFNNNLIQNTKSAMLHYEPMISEESKYSGFNGVSNEIKLSKAKIFAKFLRIAHQADLVRCWDSRGDKKFPSIYNKLVSDLLSFLNDISYSEKIAAELIDYAARACIATGNKVKLFSPEHGVKYDYSYQKRKKAKCVSDIKYGFKRLEKL